MQGKRVLHSMRLQNVLSFGSEGQTLELEPLNVLIGPNGSGKSNLVDVLALVRALPRDLALAIRAGGGIDAWFWKGRDPGQPLEIETTWIQGHRRPDLHHRFSLTMDAGGNGLQPRVAHELIDQGSRKGSSYHYHYKYSSLEKARYAGPDIYDAVDKVKVAMAQAGFRTDASILAQRHHDERHPALAFLSGVYHEIRLFRDWTFGPAAPLRLPQRADLPGEFLLENLTNLGLVLNALKLNKGVKSTITSHLNELYEGATDIHLKVFTGYLEMLVEEDNGRLIPQARLSDGTLRYLCLLAILCHPDPPPLIAIEEPELGLHPDLMRTVAKLLLEASQRTQLIVTTHSAELVTALWEAPEAVVVCERGIGGTELRRLDPEKMEKWLKKYSLGDLWLKGEIGGTRW